MDSIRFHLTGMRFQFSSLTLHNMKKKQSFQRTKQHGGSRSGAGNPGGGLYGKKNSKSIRMPLELATPEIRQAIVGLSELAKSEGRDVLWLHSKLQEQGLSWSQPGSLRSRQLSKRLRKYSISAAASFNVISDEVTDDGGYEDVDIIDELTSNPDLTFIVTVTGSSMVDAGIFSGDRLFVEQINYPMQIPASGNIVLASIDGCVTVKQYRQLGERAYLVPKNTELERVEITEEMNFEVYGIVRSVIHSL